MTKRQAAFLSIISNSILIIFKLMAGIAIGSISILSEAIHSSIDLLASLIAFFSIRKASEKEDSDHPFGHGKYENVSGFVEAILILFAAVIIIYEAVDKLIKGSNVTNVFWGIIVMFVASAVNFIISMELLKIAKKTSSIALEADGMHLLTDVFTSLGVFLGLSLIKLTGIKLLDPITAIAVAMLILKTSIGLIKKSMVDLVDSSLPSSELETITKIINSYDEVIAFHKLRTRKCGDTREIDIHLEVNKRASLMDAHNLCDEIEEGIQNVLPSSNVTIHVEPHIDIVTTENEA